ncbi:MAG: EAL domain-containing protein [Hyphomonadaceae bacterium]|nr:EAL domain-containing protein [Hyphomonadaceae bacterium]
MGGFMENDATIDTTPDGFGWITRFIDSASGASTTPEEARRRRMRILFLLLATITPLLVFTGNTEQSVFHEEQMLLWAGVLVGASTAFYAALRLFKAERTIGIAFGLWVLTVIAHGPLYYGDPAQIALTTLVLIPLIMGSVSGASASLAGTILVILTYFAVLGSAHYQQHQITDAAISLISYSMLSTVLCGVLVSHFQRHTEAEAKRLTDDNAKVHAIAMTDSLTRCANRRAFQMAMEQISENADSKVHPALFIMDLDRFKQINDTFGHSVGDEVLRTFAERLRNVVAESGRVFRLGGDEFAILFFDEPSQSALEDLAVQIRALSEAAIATQAGDVDFDVSIGIALSDGSEASNSQLYRQADNAAFAAKKLAGSAHLVFNNQIDGQITRQYEVEECLKVAIAKRSIGIAFQPQYDLRNGAIVAYEALARWKDPLLGKVSPAEFIQIAEKTRLIEVLDQQIISTALRNASKWLGRQQRVSINVSARSLRMTDFAAYVLKHVRRAQLDPSQVEIEITETALIENWDAAKHTVDCLRRDGIRIVLDDFGIGYSSLSYLAEFPVQKLKFDRSFLLKACESSNSLIMRSIINLAKEMQVEMVAEGIETREQLNLLRQLKCQQGQGYLLGRPIPAVNMDKFVKSRRMVA